MMRTLVSIEVDLASSMAIRYACQLGNLIPMELQPVYVKGYPFEEPVTGIGWVRHTWEKELVKEGKEEISEMIAGEMDTCPVFTEFIQHHCDGIGFLTGRASCRPYKQSLIDSCIVQVDQFRYGNAGEVIEMYFFPEEICFIGCHHIDHLEQLALHSLRAEQILTVFPV